MYQKQCTKTLNKNTYLLYFVIIKPRHKSIQLLIIITPITVSIIAMKIKLLH